MDIKKARKAMGLTQAKFGERLGVNHSIISRMEKGFIPVSLRTQLAVEALLTRDGIKL